MNKKLFSKKALCLTLVMLMLLTIFTDRLVWGAKKSEVETVIDMVDTVEENEYMSKEENDEQLEINTEKIEMNKEKQETNNEKPEKNEEVTVNEKTLLENRKSTEKSTVKEPVKNLYDEKLQEMEHTGSKDYIIVTKNATVTKSVENKIDVIMTQKASEIKAQKSSIDITQENGKNIIQKSNGKVAYKTDEKETPKTEEKIVTQNDRLLDNNMLLAELTVEEAEMLRKQDDVLFVEEDFLLKANNLDEPILENPIKDNLEEDQGFDEMMEYYQNRKTVEPEDYEWNMKMVNANDIDNEESKVKDKVKVAILDSGVDIVRGIELTDTINLVQGEEEFPTIFLDQTGHGTAVASIISGNPQNMVQGINPNVALYSVKALDEHNQAPISRIIEGIYWCIDNGMNIINMSFGTPNDSNAMRIAIENAYNAGVLMVASSGNNSGKVHYPAAYPQVLGVAATDTDAQVTEFSNTGKEVEIAAPGEKVLVASYFGGQAVMHGTSIAAPHISGAASLLWQKDTSKSNEFIRQLLTYSAKVIEDSDDFGLLDVEFALETYDDFTKNFNGTTVNEKKLPDNTDEPETFEEIRENENYVEGVWYTDTAKDPGGKSHRTIAASVTNIQLIKDGAIWPDTSSGPKGMTYAPQFHGYHTINATGHPPDINYIASYILITKFANATGVSNYTQTPGIAQDGFNFVKAWIGDNTYLPKEFTKAERKLFLWGVAMHTATDVFAHSSFTLNEAKTGWIYVSHNENVYPGDTDNSKVIPSRFTAASKTAEYVIARYNSGQIGNHEQFKSAYDLEPKPPNRVNYRLAFFDRFSKETAPSVDFTIWKGVSYDTVNNNPGHYTISYNGNGHTGGTVPATQYRLHGEPITLSSSIPTRIGYTFVGWTVYPEDSNSFINWPGRALAGNDSNFTVTLYALWDPQKQTLPDGVYHLRNLLSGKYADVYFAYSSDGTTVNQHWFHKGTNQQWRITYLKNGYYKITPMHAPGKALQVAGGSSENLHCYKFGQIMELLHNNGKL